MNENFDFTFLPSSLQLQEIYGWTFWPKMEEFFFRLKPDKKPQKNVLQIEGVRKVFLVSKSSRKEQTRVDWKS